MPSEEDFKERLLVVVRHAHRVKPKLGGGAADNGISDKGRKQARAIRRWFRKEHGVVRGAQILFLSSPKLRCLETLQPLAKACGAGIKTAAFLDEGGSFELKARQLENFWLEQKARILVVCSHGDVIPVALHYLTGARAELSKGGVAEIEQSGAGVQLRTLLQDP